MKKLWILACLFVILPISAFAAGTKSKTLTLTDGVQVAGKELKAGDYKLKWSDNDGDTTNVAIYDNNNKEVATVPARIVHQKNTTGASYELNTAGGANQLDRVYTSNEVVELGNGGTPGM
jgi:hypothetical protein